MHIYIAGCPRTTEQIHLRECCKRQAHSSDRLTRVSGETNTAFDKSYYSLSPAGSHHLLFNSIPDVAGKILLCQRYPPLRNLLYCNPYLRYKPDRFSRKIMLYILHCIYFKFMFYILHYIYSKIRLYVLHYIYSIILAVQMSIERKVDIHKQKY